MRTMETQFKEIELLENALEALRKTTGINFTIEGMEIRYPDNHIADALLRLVKNGMDRQFVVEVKRWLTPGTLVLAINQLNLFEHKGLIVADYVNPNLADKFKEVDIPFIDTVGNAYLNEPPIYVFVKGNKPPGITHKREKVTRAFQPTGLKLVFLLLCNQNLVNAPYRDIQKAALVALGTVGLVMKHLRDEGYILDMGKRGKKLINKKKMLEKWVEAYNEKLRPKLFIGIYKADKYDWWKFAKINEYGAYWGGEVAAAIVTEYLKPEIATIYIKDKREKLARLLLMNKLKQDTRGNVEILDAFWENDYDLTNPELVHPLITYADLLATGDARNIETAQKIYVGELIRLIGED